MIRNMLIGMAVSHMGFCSSESSTSQQPTASAFTCSEYQIMVDVEFELLDECSSDEQCEQFLDGIDCGGSIVSNVNYDPSYLYELYDEAISYGCSISVAAECNPYEDATATCNAGYCQWSE